jgi:hypothetical protein
MQPYYGVDHGEPVNVSFEAETRRVAFGQPSQGLRGRHPLCSSTLVLDERLPANTQSGQHTSSELVLLLDDLGNPLHQVRLQVIGHVLMQRGCRRGAAVPFGESWPRRQRVDPRWRCGLLGHGRTLAARPVEPSERCPTWLPNGCQLRAALGVGGRAYSCRNSVGAASPEGTGSWR